MTFKSMRLLFVCITLLALTGLIAACGGGGGSDTNPPVGEDFSLLVSASTSTGTSPLTVTFFATPSGGAAPYTYAWDFDGDGVTDSNASNGTYIYTASGVATVAVTDAVGKIVKGSRSVTIIAGGGGGAGEELKVRFNAAPQVGNVPFECQFTAIVTGGKKPYSYSWDFEGDGTPDSFLENPLYVYERVGQEVGSSAYVFYPILTVTDSRGVKATNLDDADGNTLPDFKVPINAMPQSELSITATANPLEGQAPLTVEFTGATSGGSSNFEYRWDFGDGQNSQYTASSIISHTYFANGIYLATCTVRDITSGQVKSSAALRVVAALEQAFHIAISGDLASGQVPFLVNFEVLATNGKEPIQYQWDVFDDNSPTEPLPTLTTPPSLNPNAVVTPNFTYRKNPMIHFANTARVNGTKSYVVRCVAQDSLGNTAISNLLRVGANGSYPPSAVPYYYEAERPDVVGELTFRGQSSHPAIVPYNSPAAWSPRANAAVCSHPSGITFIFGGEILDENGNLEDLVDRGDSCYMYVPRPAGAGYSQATIGKFNLTGNSIDGNAMPGMAGGLVKLNDDYAPAFPGQSDRMPPAQPTMRSSQFDIVGSAAAALAHELPESNPTGAYQSARNNPDTDINPFYPDDPSSGWGPDAPPNNTNGLGCPVIYVFGGRDQNGTPTNEIQKYIVYGFGTEELAYDSVEDAFQTTINQTNIWSNYYYRPDTDQYPDPEAVPVIQNVNALDLPSLPQALYGLTAVTVETGVQASVPSYPNGPFRNVYLFGGINGNNQVVSACYSWNLATEPEGGQQDESFQTMTPMPRPRAYAKAIFLPYTFQIIVVGGHDQNGTAINTIDILSLNNPFNPVAGSWTTFEGTLPEALEACGAGYLDNAEPSESWVMTFGGWNENSFSNSIYQARLRSQGNVTLKSPVPVVPRRNAGSAQAGSRICSMLMPMGVSLTYNRFYLAAGVDENGSDSIIEVVSLP
jgi:PKD repeat protein